MRHLRESKPASRSTSPRPRRAKAEQTWRKILERHRGLSRRVTGSAIAVRLSPVLLPVLLRYTLDPIRDRRSVEWLGRTWTPVDLLLLTLAVGLVIAAVRAVATGIFVMLAGRYGHAVVADLRVAMYEHILRLPVKYLDRRGVGRVMLRFIGDSDALRNWLARSRPAAIGDLFLMGALTAALAVVSWPLAVVACIVLPLIGGALWTLRPQLRERTLESRRRQAQFTGHIEARLRNIRQAKWIDRYQAWRDQTRQLAADIAASNAHRDRRSALLQSTGQFLTYGLLPLAIAGGVMLLWQGDLTLGKFIAVTWIVMHLAVALVRAMRTLVVREKAMVSKDRVLRLLERSAESGRGNQGAPLRRPRPELRIDQLIFAECGLGSERFPWTQRFDGPSLVLLPDDIIAADWFDVLLRFRKPVSGSIYLGGHDIREVRLRDVRRAIGWVRRAPVIYEGTIEENLRLAAPHQERQELVTRVEQFELDIRDAEAWLAQSVGRNGHSLSHDDRARVAFLQAVLNRPPILLVDPLDGMSPQLRRILADRLARLGACRSLVFVSGSALWPLPGKKDEQNRGPDHSEPTRPTPRPPRLDSVL